MNEIVKKETLAPSVIRCRINAPRIAGKRRAGQFVILRAEADGERIPLTIANADAEQGWIEIIFQVVGHGTTHLAALDVGDEIVDLVGPLGKPTHVERFGHCLCIGGGVGIAPLYPIVSALREAGNRITTILGARHAELLILEEEMAARSDALYVATDDGSKGHKGFAADVFRQRLESGEHFDFAVVIGPPVMMKVTTALTVAEGIRTVASLNPIMVDGTGMCGGCRVTVHGQTRFACVDGPEFDAAGIDWDELVRRLSSYKDAEHRMMDEHCKLAGAE